jgi:hypothetical protein
MKLKIRDVGRLFGHDLPKAPGRSKCPIQKHHRDDKTFRVFEAKTSGDELFKCWSCDDPDNTGDAVKLYALLAHVDNAEAFKRLKDMGYELGSPTYEPMREKPRVPARGSTDAADTITLDEAILARFRKDPVSSALIDRFAKERHLDAQKVAPFMVGLPREFPGGAVGFVYMDPATGTPCRIKVRGLAEKRFFVIPKGKKDSGQRAKAPLYLAENLRLHALEASRHALSSIRVVIVTEGEVDALSLYSAGIKNVVSLPDGSKSAETCDVVPLLPYSTWVLAFDDDDPGKEAAMAFRERARRYGSDVVSVIWTRTQDGAVRSYKDTNQALMDGMGRDEFVAAVDRKLSDRYGCAIPWIRAA